MRPECGRRRRPARASLAVALLAGSCCFGCKSDAERAHQGQVARLAEHIERLRRADNHAKREPLAALAAVPCPDTDTCALQDLCLRGYRLHQSALDAIAGLDRLSRNDAAPPPDVRQRLEQAERDLNQAKSLTEACAEQQIRVVRHALMP
jgi:hypothetical protein